MSATLPYGYVWVVETRDDDGLWLVAETIHLDPAVYLSRDEARRALRNGEVAGPSRDRRIRAYYREDGR